MVEICHKLDLLFVLKAFIPDFHLIFFQVFYFRILTEFYNGCIAHSVSTAIIKFMLTIVKQMYFYMHNLFILWGLNNKVNHKCHVCWLGFPLLTTGNYKKEKTMSGVGQSVWCECRFWIDYRHFFFFFSWEWTNINNVLKGDERKYCKCSPMRLTQRVSLSRNGNFPSGLLL